MKEDKGKRLRKYCHLQVKKSELRCQLDQMHDDEVIIEAQNPFHVKLLNGGELSRDVMIFKVSSHLGKFRSTAEGKN